MNPNRESGPPDSRAASHFAAGLSELDAYLFHFEEAALSRAVASFRAATGLRPGRAEYWLALGFVLDASDMAQEALTALLRADAAAPGDEEVEVFILTLRSELGPESEAVAAVEAYALQKSVDLESLRKDLTAAGMTVDARTLLLNGFLHARNFVRSRLQDSIDQSMRGRDPNEWARVEAEEKRLCEETRTELQAAVTPDEIPAGLRGLTPWALRLGVGDDVCRGAFVAQLTSDERTALHRLVHDHAEAIGDWLDGFGDDPMTPEAAAFMYLQLAAEDIGHLNESEGP